MSHSSGRGQVEPLVALVATVSVCLGLAFYVGLHDDAMAVDRSSPTVETTAQRAVETVAPGGVARPGRLDRLPAVSPDGFRLNATLTTGDRRWQIGPAPPDDAPTALRPVSVHVGTGMVRPGGLRVVVWS